MKDTKRALIASDSTIFRDPRVSKQIEWLIDEGWTVDTVGRGPYPSQINGTHFEMPLRPYVSRVLANLILPNGARYRHVVESNIPEPLRSTPLQHPYDLAVLNEIELLPWFTRNHRNLVRPGARIHLDLHEFSPSQRTGLLFQLVFKRYRGWMTTFIPSSIFTSRTVVAPGVADLYTELFGFEKPAVVRNCPPYVDIEPSSVDPADIKLVHHGGAVTARGLDSLIEAMESIDNRFSLHLMLVGSPRIIGRLKRKAAKFGQRVTFHEPVPMDQVAQALNRFDAEVIFYPPTSENMRLSLPNKFFESIQGRLGLITGESPEMETLIREHGFGSVASGWEYASLAAHINSITADQISAMKAASHKAAPTLSAESERHAFLLALGAPA